MRKFNYIVGRLCTVMQTSVVFAAFSAYVLK